MNPRPPVVAVASLATLLGVVGLVGYSTLAGPLDPPAGPVTPTFKTLSEVEPRTAINLTNTPGDSNSLFKIAQPGSYYLTGNIAGVIGKHGIEITASGVTVDLNGFDLAGLVGMGPFDGVSAAFTNLSNITVVNGSIRNWGGDGVDLSPFGTANCLVERIRSSGNVGVGIATGVDCTIADCSAKDNGASGIATGAGCTLSECEAFRNAGSGIITALSSISNCSANFNSAVGIVAGNGSTLNHCSSTVNGTAGFLANFGCTFSNCSAYANSGLGISTSDDCSLTNCSAISNSAGGITTGGACTAVDCTANSNLTTGITLGSGSTVTSCTATANTAIGINAGNSCTVADCTVQSNITDGIRCASKCVIRGNNCSTNGLTAGVGANIRATLVNNRIEGNNCSSADFGILVENFGNIIIRNTCSSNTTNWSFVSNNYYGPIINRFGVMTPAVSGDATTGGLGSTDPNANFTY